VDPDSVGSLCTRILVQENKNDKFYFCSAGWSQNFIFEALDGLKNRKEFSAEFFFNAVFGHQNPGSRLDPYLLEMLAPDPQLYILK
jgi:hypothetical protein